jgi:hypothetical protein
MSPQVSLKQTFFFYFKCLAVSSASAYAFLWWRCSKLRREADDEEVLMLKKDTTRPSNEYYGINWGYRADNTIEKAFNTGDVVFFDYNCSRCLYPSEVVK